MYLVGLCENGVVPMDSKHQPVLQPDIVHQVVITTVNPGEVREVDDLLG